MSRDNRARLAIGFVLIFIGIIIAYIIQESIRDLDPLAKGIINWLASQYNFVIIEIPIWAGITFDVAITAAGVKVAISR